MHVSVCRWCVPGVTDGSAGGILRPSLRLSSDAPGGQFYAYLFTFNHFSSQSFDEKVANVSLAFELMMDGGLPQPKARPEDIVNLDLKSTLRVLYNLFTKYKHLS